MKRNRLNLVFPAMLVAVAGTGFLASTHAQEQQPVVAIKAARLIDGTGAAVIENAVILISGGSIQDAGPASRVQIPPGARTLDLGQRTILPGLIDGHAHLTVRGDYRGVAGEHEQQAQPMALQMARVVRNLRVSLMTGVTTFYMAGDANSIEMQTIQAIQEGYTPGPRIYPGGIWISTTAGGGLPEARTINGPWEFRRRVREAYEAGAHHVKLMVVNQMSVGPNRGHPFGPGASNFTEEEIDAAVNEAHRLGMKVTAHASGEQARLALEAGVDSVQHGEALTAELIAMMVQKHVGIVNTYVIGYETFFRDEWSYLDNDANDIRDWYARVRKLMMKERRSDPRLEESIHERWSQIKKAKDAGVLFAVGTDNIQGALPLEIFNLVDSGFTPLEAIGAGTGVGAKVLGIDTEVGTIQKGRFADIIAVNGAPDRNIRDLERIDFLMVGGKDYSALSFK
jgi:imidazolonepropionase-like amidohydrolase